MSTLDPTTYPIIAPTIVPSISDIPVAVPTPAPSSSSVLTTHPTSLSTLSSRILVSYNVSQVIDGLTLSNYYEDESTNSKVFVDSVMESVELYAQSSGINIFMVSEPPLTSHNDYLADSNSEITFLYEIRLVVGEGNDYSSAESAYQDTTTKLTDKINRGEFTESMHKYANKYESDTMQSAEASNSPEYSEPVLNDITENYSTTSVNESADYSLPIIISASVSFSVIFIGIARYYMFYRKRKLISYGNTWRSRGSIAYEDKHDWFTSPIQTKNDEVGLKVYLLQGTEEGNQTP